MLGVFFNIKNKNFGHFIQEVGVCLKLNLILFEIPFLVTNEVLISLQWINFIDQFNLCSLSKSLDELKKGYIKCVAFT